MQCFIFHIKVIPEASFPLPCSTSSKSCTLPCLQGYCCRGDDQPIPLKAHLHQAANPLLGGLAARTAVPLGESPEPHETHRPFALWRRFSVYAPLSEPARRSTHRQRKPEAGGRGQLKQQGRGRCFTPLTSGPVALRQCELPQ